MKLLLKIVFVVYAATLCCAQTDSKSSSVPAPANQPPVSPSQASRNPPGQNASAGPSTVAPEAAPQAAAPQTVSATDELQPARKPGTEGKADAAASSTDAKSAYVIGPLDVLMIRVWNSPNLSGLVNVTADGMISMQLIGEVKADGLTKKQLQASIAEHLNDFLNNPLVDVQVEKVNSKRYFVYGGVGRAGEFPLIRATTVMDALSNVGGFREFANTRKIYILRGTKRFNFNYKDVSKGKNLEQNILLQNGDQIFVPE